MASLFVFRGSYSVRFRYAGKAYKRSLKTSDKEEAQTAVHRVCVAMHHLRTGQLTLPAGIDVAEFIASGGVLPPPPPPPDPEPIRYQSIAKLVKAYLAAQFQKATSSVGTERTHLNNLKKELGAKADLPGDQVTLEDLTVCLQRRPGAGPRLRAERFLELRIPPNPRAAVAVGRDRRLAVEVRAENV